MAKYPWDRAREMYVEGQVDDKGERTWPRLSDVAEQLVIPSNRVRERSAADNWTSARAAFQAHMAKVRQDRRAAELAKEATELDGRALTGAKMGIQLINARLGEIAKAMGEIAKKRAELERRKSNALPLDGLDEDLEIMGQAVDAREMDSLARAAEAWHRLGARALGDVETTRTEITGAGGAPLEVRSTIKAELTRDDPNRLAGVLVSLERSGVIAALQGSPLAIAGAGDQGDAGG